MKRILISLAVIAVVGAVGWGATKAYFSDTATITGNTFTAGTMDLKIDSNPLSTAYTWSDGFTNPSNPFANVKPGDGGEQIIDIMNEGNVDGTATIDLNRTSAYSDIAGKLNFVVEYDGDHDGNFEATGLSGTVDQYTQAYVLGPITSEDDIASIKIIWSVPTSAGNEIQGDSVTINAVFGLAQSVAQPE